MADDESLFDVRYVPPPPPEPGKFVVRPRVQGQYPTLHLSPNEAFDLWSALADALNEAIKAGVMKREDT